MSDEIKATEDTTEPSSAPASAPSERPPHREKKFGEHKPRGYGDRDGAEGGYHKSARFKRKSCRFCANKNLAIDYKDADLLQKFITDRGKILPRRITGNCAKHQRLVAKQIKRARIIAILPFVLQ